ncbi:Uncharacterized protein SCG7086_CF_00020 [Chlamydiales bacterium SCGC AG-110-P3]|nr:Uncharacterized protein SCG7086_CF_00020 [Chlamydiales bacterium SCGC AG-110-P3]
MFKRYRNPLEKDLSNTPFESERSQSTITAPPVKHSSAAPALPSKRSMAPYRQQENRVPPRVSETSKPTTASPYTPPNAAQSRPPQGQIQSHPTNERTSEPVRRTSEARAPLLSSTLSAEEPDTTLGEGVVFKGELTFKRLLRIDGQFEGDLVSDGKLIVGPTGIVKSNVRMHEAIIEGRVEGNITVQERLELRCNAQVIGDIKAKQLSVDEGVSIVGHVAVSADNCQRQGHDTVPTA